MNPWGTIGHLSRKEIRALQNKKLRHFVNTQLYPFSAYYRNLFDHHGISPRSIRSVEDLKNIPLTSKTDFVDLEKKVERYRNFILQPDESRIRQYWPAGKKFRLALGKILRGSGYIRKRLSAEYRPIFVTLTTGTTQFPLSYFYSPYDIRNLHLSGARMLALFDCDDSERFVNMFPYAPHLAFWQVVFGGLEGGVMMMSTGGGKVMGTEGNILALLKMKPSVILGVPSYVYHVLRIAREKGYRMDFLKKIVLGAASVSEPFKLKVRSLLESLGAHDVYVLGTYGFTEARQAWAECPAPPGMTSGYHLYPDKEIFEVIDPNTQEIKGEGEDGELVYTSVDSRGSAVLRYRTGDFVKGGITYEPCPFCRRTVPRISSDISRLSDIKNLDLSKIKGQLVNLNNFSAALNKLPAVEEWQIVIRKKDDDPHEIDELTVYISADENYDKNKLERDIKSSILLSTEISPNRILFVSFDELIKRLELETASKEKRIVDLRPEHSSR
ncbi:MAG: AMP-binding protein [Candidatus Omnitrophota bacterium]